MRQLFLNLLDNAIKYAGEGKRIELSLRRDLANGEVRGIRCAICDTGPGIPIDHRPHLTRRFYRASPSGVPGSGLGLALAAEILRHHGSQIEIESRTMDEAEQTGTCVSFTLPLLPLQGTLNEK